MISRKNPAFFRILAHSNLIAPDSNLEGRGLASTLDAV
jgi:hypothetical protein